MTEHLPECWAKDPSDPPAWCICEKLRACEDRVARAFHVVRKDDTRKWEKFSLDQFDAGFSEGLDAAREAVENMRDALHTHYRIGCEPPGKVDWSQHRKCDPVDDILAAIDALREEQK